MGGLRYLGARHVLQGAGCGWETEAERCGLASSVRPWDSPLSVTGGDVGTVLQEAEASVFPRV